MATFMLQDKDFIHFAGWKKHVSLYPVTDEMRSELPEITNYKSSGVTVQFPLNKPLPTELIGKTVRWLLADFRG